MLASTPTSKPSPGAPAQPPYEAQKGRYGYQATYPSTALIEAFKASQRPTEKALGDAVAVTTTHSSKRNSWGTLQLRQQWADVVWLRGHLSVAGVKVNVTAEPATVPRLKALLRRAGVMSAELQESVGMPLKRYLVANPGLPLWVALSMVLEATGRFTPPDREAV